jgi:glycosyltransferase involved in cell wall biosynthesis
MQNIDLVSVIIPVFNREKLICEAVDSVLHQTYPHWELLIADDGSTDNTLSVLEKYKKYPRIRVLPLKHCGNPGQVRNSAVKDATGKWLAFLDSDDLWMKEKLEKQLLFLSRHRDFRFIHTLERWERNGKVVSQAHRKHEKEGDLFRTSLGKCEIGPSTVIMERDLYQHYGGFRNDLEICEDYEFWLRITAENPVAYLDEELVVKKGGHDDQLSTKYGFIEIFKIDALRYLVDENWFEGEKMILARDELARKCRIYSKGCRKRGKEKEAQEFESLYFFYSGDETLK